MRLLSLTLLALLPAAARAQAGPIWPRNAAGRIEFRGQLAWPDTARTEAQRQLLARRWYRRGLTSNGASKLRELLQQAGSTYAGVPAESRYQLRLAGPDHEQYRLCFRLHLVADSAALHYQLTEFDVYYSAIDVGGGDALEDLSLADPQPRAVLAGFHQRLRDALRSW